MTAHDHPMLDKLVALVEVAIDSKQDIARALMSAATAEVVLQHLVEELQAKAQAAGHPTDLEGTRRAARASYDAAAAGMPEVEVSGTA